MSYDTGNPVPSKDPRDLVDNAEKMDEAVNGTGDSWTDRLGNSRPTLKRLEDDYPQAGVDADRAEAAAAGAETARAAAVTAQSAAETAQTGAETAETNTAASASAAATSASDAQAYADAAAAAPSIYADTAAGLAATIVDDYFYTPSGEADELLILYRHDTGPVATEIGRTLSASALDELNSIVRDEYAEEYAYTVRDQQGNVAFGVKNDGTVVFGAIDSEDYGSIDYLRSLISTVDGSDLAYSINDDRGRVAFYIKQDGTVGIGHSELEYLNKVHAPTDLRPDYELTFPAEVMYFTNTGQSLATGQAPAITNTQEYDNVGFAYEDSTPSAFLPLTAPLCGQGDVESPMYGIAGNIKEVLQRENSLTTSDQNFKLCFADNSRGSWAISALSKGTQYYDLAISQAGAAMSLAADENKTFAVGAVFWTQGEADSGNGYSYYLNAEKTLAADYNADLKAVTGQSGDIPFISYQIGSTTANRDVALAQLQASEDVSYIYVACPMYQFEYKADGVHLTPDSSKWQGGYYGLAYKRVVVDGVGWTPTKPASATVYGNFVNVVFDVMAAPLVIDTDLVPEQTDYGFTLVDSTDSPLVITGVEMVGPKTIKIISDTTIPAGSKLRYGFNSATGKGGYTGGCGNLRDSQGEFAEYFKHPLHNWCVIFEFAL